PPADVRGIRLVGGPPGRPTCHRNSRVRHDDVGLSMSATMVMFPMGVTLALLGIAVLCGLFAPPASAESLAPRMAENIDTAAGLTTDEAHARLTKYGPNEPATARRHSIGADLWHVLANPLVLILVIAAAASAFLGDVVDAGLITTIVIISAAIDMAQTHRSQAAVERLRDRVAPTATVLR